MKKNLGKILLFLYFPFILYADSSLATYAITVNKKDAFVKEAVEVTFTAYQKEHSNVMFFFLEPEASKDYSIELLSHDTKVISRHNNLAIFKYLLFPLKDGVINIDFKFTVKMASDEAVAQIYTGDYSKVKWVETTDSDVPIQPLLLHVKPLEKNIDLVGDFSITQSIQSDKINQYGSANIKYFIHGTGYAPKTLDLLKKTDGVTLFDETTDHTFKATSNGYEINREFDYALVSQKNFKVPEVNLNAYSPSQQKYYTLTTKPYDISVTAIDPSTLVDAKDFPQKIRYNFEYLIKAVIALLIFLAGFLTAKLSVNIPWKMFYKKEKFLDIKNANSAKELLLILVQNYAQEDIHSFIDKLERLQYQNSHESFKDIKKQLLKKIM